MKCLIAVFRLITLGLRDNQNAADRFKPARLQQAAELAAPVLGHALEAFIGTQADDDMALLLHKAHGLFDVELVALGAFAVFQKFLAILQKLENAQIFAILGD